MMDNNLSLARGNVSTMTAIDEASINLQTGFVGISAFLADAEQQGYRVFDVLAGMYHERSIDLDCCNSPLAQLANQIAAGFVSGIVERQEGWIIELRQYRSPYWVQTDIVTVPSILGLFDSAWELGVLRDLLSEECAERVGLSGLGRVLERR